MIPRARKKWKASAAVFAAVGCAALSAGCEGELGQQFRDATRDEFETGINALLDGVVQGAFEVYAPDNDETPAS